MPKDTINKPLQCDNCHAVDGDPKLANRTKNFYLQVETWQVYCDYCLKNKSKYIYEYKTPYFIIYTMLQLGLRFDGFEKIIKYKVIQ